MCFPDELQILSSETHGSSDDREPEYVADSNGVRNLIELSEYNVSDGSMYPCGL
ncbi:MAG: hypothetical protein J07HQW2_00331 [Haloquadratum walsbyi J07HQW2]|jgi:hypothetical protein|uniref:Uncharacterized protein n=1 Tax=Haloquadratum walsbyi J07HQW2 TaxID=1238425 RepID=U1PJS0_9EURY|nr:MAG: hypothetical protein J07HQW2_00331 [Haloquadratum walsbyi J07HQW2]